MATFLEDTFTESASGKSLNPGYDPHAADTGGNYARHASSDEGMFQNFGPIDQTNDEAYGAPTTGTNGVWYAGGVPADSAQQTVWHLVRRGAYNTGQGIRFYHRMSTTFGDAIAVILANDQASSVRAYLYKYVSGSLTAFSTGGTPASFTMTQDAVTYVKFITVGTTAYLGYSTDGVTYTTLFSLTDASAPTQVGRVGLAFTDYTATSSTGINITRLTGTDGASLPVVPGAPAPSRRRPSGLYIR